MTIYGRFGDKITIVRIGSLADVKKLDGRKPDKRDEENVANCCYVVVLQDDGKKRLYAQSYMRADGGAVEIGKALDEACLKNAIWNLDAVLDPDRPGRYRFWTGDDAWSVTPEALTEYGYMLRQPDGALKRWMDSGIDRIELDL